MMNLLFILYIPVFLSIQALLSFFFTYKEKMTIEKIESESNIMTQKPFIKYEDKYKNEYIKLDFTQLTTGEKEHLKNNFVMETTPLGNVIMCFNSEKNGFVYYSDSTIPYRFLETVGRKYITTFKCKDTTIYVDETDDLDEKTPIADEKTPIEITNDTTSSETKSITTPPTTKKNVFAKFKNYNHPNSIPSSSMIAKNNQVKITSQSNKEVKENKNKYISEGKISNFSFIKKIDKKQIVKRLNMTFAEFKKMQQESENKTSL